MTTTHRAAAVPPPPAPCRVLVVDDNLDAGESLGALLQSMDCESLVIDSGEHALRAARDWQAEVVLLDIGMPGRDGYEVARELRASGLDPMPVIVALTGWGQDVDKERTRKAGFDLHLVKPVEIEDLQRALGYRRSRDKE